MSKELVIVFLYDSELCKKEEDDPHDAIIYFYPTWVNSEQRHALCSQLMGVAQFCESSFSLPSVIALQSGKFSLTRMGRYILCVGTDRNIPDMVLKTRSNVLYQLLQLFHYDVETLQANLSEDDDSLTDKFSQLLQVYLPILQFATNTFANIPTLKIPKSASTVYLESLQTLQSFQEIPGVLGGVILYQNKIVATQLDFSLTKQLVVSDPYRIKIPAQSITTSFRLPVGVQLLTVFVDFMEAKRLRDEIEELKVSLEEVRNWRKESESLNLSKAGKGSKEGIVSGMKRDPSRIFTVVEEDITEEKDNRSEDSTGIPDIVKDAVRARQLARIEAAVPASFIIVDQPQKVCSVKTTDDILSTNRIPMRYFSLGLPKINSDWTDCPVSPRGKSSGINSDAQDLPVSPRGKRKDNVPRHYYNTICDPNFPLFKSDGLPASYPLYRSRISGHIELLKSSEATGTPKKRTRPRNIALKNDEDTPCPVSTKPVQKARRPFSLNFSATSAAPPGKGGVPLTPLMAKLTLLAQEENQLETPVMPSKLSVSKVVSPAATGSKTLPTAEETKSKFNAGPPASEKKDCGLVPLALYVFGHNATSALLLLENEAAVDPERVHDLWERSVYQLKKIEERLHQCLVDHQVPESDANAGEYSFALVDQAWGPVERGGSYQPHQLELLTTLHYTLNKRPDITDILIRSEDSVSYGNQCGSTQIFYQQNCPNNSGVPTPADLMGLIPLKARRTLERDHGIVLL